MPSNVEIKAVLSNPQAAHAIAARLSDSVPETIHQEDIFFRCSEARLKLRILGPDRGELIRYERPDIDGARLSRYSSARTPDPQSLREILTHSVGVIGTVKKTRTVYLVGQTRVHIDQVQDLGDFLELEVVLGAGQSEDEGKQIATALLSEFGITAQATVAEAYIDLLGRKS